MGRNHRGYNKQDTEILEVARHLQRQHTWTGKTLGVSDIMAVALIAGGAIARVTLLMTFFLGKSNGGTYFGQEILTNSTIGHEEKKSISSSFFFYF